MRGYVYIRFNGTDRLILIPNYTTIIGTRDQRRLVNRIDRARFRENEIVSRWKRQKVGFSIRGRSSHRSIRGLSIFCSSYFRMIRLGLESLSILI